jgi:hypothetical protein
MAEIEGESTALRGSRCGRSYVPAVSQTTEWMREIRWMIVVYRLSPFEINWLWPFEEWYNTFLWKYSTVGRFVQRKIWAKLNNPLKKCKFESYVSLFDFTFSIVNLILYGDIIFLLPRHKVQYIYTVKRAMRQSWHIHNSSVMLSCNLL